MQLWLDALTQLERDGEPSVLVTVLTARGSTPREAGCKMVVTRDGLFGTIGGGNLEYQCIADARRLLLLEPEASPVTRDFPLGPGLGQCCGGHVSVLFEPMLPTGGHVALFGAGHVGRALVKVLGDLPGRVTWIDSRLDAFPAELPANVRRRLTDAPAGQVALLPAGTLLLVMTHDHQVDFEIIAAALQRDDFVGIGLIGSATKRARFVSRLTRLGLGQDAIHRLICPIGLPGIDSKQPAAIAVSVAAQILLIQGRRQPRKPPRNERSLVSVMSQPTHPRATACATCAQDDKETCR
jgi:xanthine dehydrogenase accessory factor